MTGWFLKLIGVGEGLSSNVERIDWGWTRPAWLLLLVPAVAAGYYIVRRHAQNLPHVARLPRYTLNGCRIVVLLLLVVVLAGPIARLEETVTHKPMVAVVLDISQSMGLAAGPFGGDEMSAVAAAAGLVEAAESADGAAPVDAQVRKTLNQISRVELAKTVLGADERALMAALDERFDVRQFTAAGQLRAQGVMEAAEETGDADGARAPGGSTTALGDAIDQVIDESAGESLAGIVLLSDGRSNSGADALAVIERRGGRGSDGQPLAPVWAVPVGGRERGADIAVVDVVAPAEVAVDDTGSLVATIESYGFDGRSINVKLMKGAEAIDETPLTLLDGRRQRVELRFGPTAADRGDQLLSVEVETAAEELVGQNNRQVVSVRVDDESLRVLYLEGAPRWDFRFLDHALRRDGGLDVTMVVEAQLQAAGEPGTSGEGGDGNAGGDGGSAEPVSLPVRAKLPEDAGGFAEYDAVIVGDVSPALLPRRYVEQLVRAVEEEGVGLIVHAGSMHMPHAFGDGDDALQQILPVRLESRGVQAAMGADANNMDEAGDGGEGSGPVASIAMIGGGGLTAPAYAPFRMSVTAAGATHPALRLYDSASKNRRLWSRMPLFYWAAAAATSPAAGAEILAEFETPDGARPLIAERRVGRGRVMFIGTDSTYLWRRNIGTHLFYRFWGQAIRHVGGRSVQGDDKSWLNIYPGRVEPGEDVSIELFAVSEEGKPLGSKRLKMQVQQGEMVKAISLSPADEPGLYRGRWQSEEPGQFRFSYSDARGQVLAGAVVVGHAGLEFIRPDIDRDALGRLAEASGGGLIELHELAGLPGRLSGGPSTVTNKLEDELWDNWLTLVILIGLYCTDVGVRRVLGLS